MPNYAKTNPIGIDYWIQSLQGTMYPQLLSLWNMQDATYECYGRAYRIIDSDSKGYIPVVFKGGIDYKDCLLNDTLTALSFFSISEAMTVGKDLRNTAKVSLIMFVKLPVVKTGTTQRNDEEVRIDVLNCIDQRFGFVTTGIYTGTQVLKDYPGMRMREDSRFLDMQPWHMFRIEGELTYDNISVPYC